MRRLPALLPVLGAALWLAAPGLAAERPVTTLDVAVPAPAATAELDTPFTLVGLRWLGRGSVVVRTRTASGRWSPWRSAAGEDDRPDPRTLEARATSGWRVGAPWWTGASDRVQLRVRGTVRRIRATLVWSPPVRIPLRRLTSPGLPAIVPRVSWGADETIRRGPPTYAPSLRFAIVHHTAGRSDYTPAEAAAIVRGIQLYHVQGNGWNDIGYNFLVDRFGTIYEGRFGGIDRNVVGAHAQGFNTGSVGVAVIGTFGASAPPKAAQDALATLLAWRLDLAHLDPKAVQAVASGGSERYPPGVAVSLRTVSGHRDTGLTECPGDALYARLGALATTTAGRGLPKIYDPRVEGAIGSSVRFRARLAGVAEWSAVVTDQDGFEVARGMGTGTSVDWTWDATDALPGEHRWTIEATGATPATGTLGGRVALRIADVVATPDGVSPNGDGQADVAVLGFRLTAPGRVTVGLRDLLGQPLLSVLDQAPRPAGTHSVVIDPASLPDGPYEVEIAAVDDMGATARRVVYLTVLRTLGLVDVSPAFSPNGDGRHDTLAVRFPLAGPATVRVQVVRDGNWVATLQNGPLGPGDHNLRWDGRRSGGAVVPDGRLAVLVRVTDPLGSIALAVPFAADTRAPSLRLLPGRPLRARVSEPGALTGSIDGVAFRVAAPRAGTVRIPAQGRPTRGRVVAWDLAGNPSRAAYIRE